jgi:hypothetical protein
MTGGVSSVEGTLTKSSRAAARLITRFRWVTSTGAMRHPAQACAAMSRATGYRLDTVGDARLCRRPTGVRSRSAWLVTLLGYRCSP